MTPEEELIALRRLKELEAKAAPPVQPEGGLLDKLTSFARKTWGTPERAGVDDVVRGGAKAANAGISGAMNLSPMSRLLPMILGAVSGAPLENQLKFAAGAPEAATASRNKAITEALPVPENRGTGAQYQQAAAESLGGMAALGPNFLMQSPKAAVFSALGGGVGAKAGGDFGSSLSPQLEDIGALLGGFAGGGLPALVFGRDTSANATIGRAARTFSPDDFKKADANVDSFNRVGATTATLPELFPGNHPLLGLAEKTRGEKGGEALAARVANREADLSGLTDRFLNNIGPEVDANTVANKTSAAAEALRENLSNLKNEGFKNRIAGQQGDPRLLETYLEGSLNKRADVSQRRAPAAAYREIARALRDEKGNLITDIPTLSLELNSLGKKAQEGSLMNTGGTNISSNDLNIPLSFAKKRLGQINRPFEEAMSDAAAFNKGPRMEFSESPLNALADRNPSNAYPTPASRLNKVLSGNSPAQVESVVKSLAMDPGLSPQQRVDPSMLARALMQEKLTKGSTNPGQVLRGQEGSQAESQIAALLSAGGKNPVEVMEPLRVADRLQNFKGLPGMGTPPEKQSFLGSLLRPFRSGDFLFTDRARTAHNAEIAQMLANPTKENRAILQRLAQTDPAVAAMLRTMQGTAAPILSSSKDQ